MGGIPGGQSQEASQHQASAGLAVIPEGTAQTQQGVGQNVVQQAHDAGIQQHGLVAEVAGLEGGGYGFRADEHLNQGIGCLLYTSPSPRDRG